MYKLHYEMVGESPQMQKVYHFIQMAADNDFTVLIQGETGTGKELVAKAIHERSQRHKAPFIVLNCAAIPHELIESELFGHEKGAFTSAIRERLGKIESAHKGSILFDEVGEMDLSLQAKLLRVLEDKVVNRVGSAMYKQINTRVIASTNKCLRTKAQQNTFRDDLYYRLSVFQITLPTLRERKQDIPALARYFLDTVSNQLKKDISFIDPLVMEKLVEYDWPGNIRELKNVITRAAIMAENDSITIDHLSIVNQAEFEMGVEPAHLSFPRAAPLVEMERLAIRKMLVFQRGNKSRTAEALGIGRSSLYWKMKRYEIVAN